MAEPDSATAVATEDKDSARDMLAQLVLAAIGAVALTAERIEELVDSLVERGGIQRDEARAAVEDLASRWRGDATRVTERAGAGVHGLMRELGLVLRSEYEELELRVSQGEHRLRLLEKARDAATAPPSK
jgi:polyhydroxyalkanoate synthesis regulator phasin